MVITKPKYQKLANRLFAALDGVANRILSAEKQTELEKPYAQKPARTKLLSPEEDVKRLMTNAQTLEDVWQFLCKRLRTGTDSAFMCFSVLDESGDFIRLRFLRPQSPHRNFDQPILSTSKHHNHIVYAYSRKDTTFTNSLSDLGMDVVDYLPQELTQAKQLHIFSIPFIAAGQVIALVTIGFQELDAFSQAKLSYLYTLRDQIAQLVWNLTLTDRLKAQSQIDSLTGLLSHGYFQRLLEEELAKTDNSGAPLTAMILDINNIDEINSTHGHEKGDEAICHVASTVRKLIRGIDVVARYGGDEIVVLMPETDAVIAREIASRFMEGVNQKLPKELKSLSISIGYATYPDDTLAQEPLMKLAEQALNLAQYKGCRTQQSISVSSREAGTMDDKAVLEVLASQISKKYSHTGSMFDELVRRMEHRDDNVNVGTENLMLETIGSLAAALDAKDKYTRGHSQAVANYCAILSHALKLSPDEVEKVRLAGLLHDIGKIGIPEAILRKQGELTDEEWEVMKQHPVIGANQILAPVTSLKDIIPMVAYHHESWDGSGYPDGLKGEEIPFGARIVSLVDAFHGLTSDRSYRQALPVQDACQILQSGAGKKWDPQLVEVFLNMVATTTKRHSDEAGNGEIAQNLDPAKSENEEVSHQLLAFELSDKKVHW